MAWYKSAKSHSFEDTGHQHGWTDIFGDVQRYSLDSYRCQVFITKTTHKITVSVTVAHDMFGLIVYQDFWLFALDETSEAKRVFEQVKEVCKEVFDNYETNETPNNMLHISIREAVRHIDVSHKPSSRILSVDNARKYDGETDWRSSIYGKRYPLSGGF